MIGANGGGYCVSNQVRTLSAIPSKLNFKNPTAVKLSGGIVSARLKSTAPKSMDGVEIDINVTRSDDLVSVETGEQGTTLNMFILDYIDGYGSTDPEVIISNIKAHNPDRINLYIGSGGGDVFVAAMISDALRGNRATVTAYLTGICGSAATHISCAADRVVMSRSCFFMVHSAAVYTGYYSNNQDLEAAAKQLEAVNATQLAIYAAKTGKPESELAPLMQGDNWLTAAEALEWGFVDEVVDNIEMDLTLPGDVKQYYQCCGYDDYGWYAFVDPKTGEVRPEKEVFTACLERAKSRVVKASATPTTKTNATEAAAPSQSTDMSFYAKIVAALKEQGIIPENKAADAVANLENNSDQFIAELAKAVKAELPEAEPATTEPTEAVETKSLLEQIEDLAPEELAQIEQLFKSEPEDNSAEIGAMKEQLEAAEASAKAANDKLAELAATISAKNAGREPATTTATAPASSGKSDVVPDPSGDDAPKVSDALARVMEKAKSNGAFKKINRG